MRRVSDPVDRLLETPKGARRWNKEGSSIASSVTLILFQRPSSRIATVAIWMLKQVQHDADGASQASGSSSE
jgi:hypothetical protein